jgi:hypothetical protein
MSSFGTVFRVTTFGESHCKGVGCIVDGVPPGIALVEAGILRFVTFSRRILYLQLKIYKYNLIGDVQVKVLSQQRYINKNIKGQVKETKKHKLNDKKETKDIKNS